MVATALAFLVQTTLIDYYPQPLPISTLISILRAFFSRGCPFSHAVTAQSVVIISLDYQAFKLSANRIWSQNADEPIAFYPDLW